MNLLHLFSSAISSLHASNKSAGLLAGYVQCFIGRASCSAALTVTGMVTEDLEENSKGVQIAVTKSRTPVLFWV